MIRYRKPGEFLLLMIIMIAALATPALAGLVLPNDTGTGASINQQTLSLPLSFIENQGQSPDVVKYQVNAAGHSIAFEPDRIVLAASQDVNNTTKSAEVTMTFPGSSASPAIAGLDRLPGNASFFLGNDSSRWQSDVPTYRSVEYQQLYPGIDLRYNGTQGVLKREFVVAPGTSPDQIAIAYDGIDGLAIAENGSLAITTSLGVLTDEAPVAYQAIDGIKVPVTSSYRLKDDGTVGFTVGAYDQSRPLVIDPTLLYSSYFGGSNQDFITRVRLDSAGNIYLAGLTSSADFTIQNSNQAPGGSNDAFVTKLNPEGTAVLYSSYLGGSGDDVVRGMSIDGSGNIYLAGVTASTDFPLQSPFQLTNNEGKAGFVTKLNPSNPAGSQLVYSTYIDGNTGNGVSTGANGIVADPSGGAYVAGVSNSPTLPVTADAAQPALSGTYDAYLARIGSDGSLMYLTYLGGAKDEGGSNYVSTAGSTPGIMGIGLDSAGNVYVSGSTKSTDFPTLNPYQSVHGGTTTVTDAFVAKYTATGSKVYATYLGGTTSDVAYDLAVDPAGAVYVTGNTGSTNFPLVNPAQSAMKGTSTAFITKIDPSGTSLDYSTYWGGSSGTNTPYSIAVDGAGDAYVAGATLSTDYPIINGAQSAFSGRTDGFVVKFGPAGNALYSTVIGGNGENCNNFFYGIGVNDQGDAVVGGSTSSNYPTTASAIQQTNRDTLPGYCGIFSILTDKAVADFTATPTTGYAPLSVQFNDTSKGSPTNWSWDFGDNATSTEQNATHTYTAAGLYSVNLTASNSLGSTHLQKTDYITVLDRPGLPEANFTANVTNGTAPLAVQFNDTSLGGNLTAWSWVFGDGATSTEQNPVHTYAAGGNYTVNLTVTNSGGSNSTEKVDYISVARQPLPEANFTANVTTGIAPLSVQFNDTSLGANLTAWSWAFGDGNISTEQNPIHTYATTGSYSVNLTVTNVSGSNSSVKTNYINVSAVPLPVANFTANVTTGFAPLSVQFNDTSLGTNLTAWSWSFGDGATSTVQNPINNYTTAGSYTVNLTVTNASGSNTTTKTDYIIVTASEAPIANFSANITNGTAPLAVQFNDTSLGVNLTAWSWAFGDGNTSTVQNPIYNYTAAGSYTVNLTVTNATGSDNEVKTNYINVSASVTPTPTVTVGPLSAVRHIFINTANGVKYNYDGATYGGPNNTYYVKADGGGLNELHLTNDANVASGQVTTTGAQNGTFYVTNTGGRGFDDDIILLVSVKGPIPDDFGIHLTSNGYTWTPSAAGVYNPTAPTDSSYVTGIDQTFSKADFIYGPQTWKPGPHQGSADLVTPYLPLYTGQDINDASTAQYLMFVDLKAGNVKQGVIPSATLNNGALKVDYSITNLSTRADFNGFAWANASNQGQGITWTNNVFNPGASGYSVTAPVAAPVAGFNASVTNGTAPLAVQFNDLSTGTPTSWSWDFGDGNTSTTQSPSHTYTAAGNYTVNLTATNAGGSNTTVKTNYITVTGSETPTAPVANFNANITNGTAPLAVQFTDLSTGAPVTWSWSFGDGNTSTVQNPAYTYAAAGNYTVNLTATNAGGSNTLVKTNYITVTSPAIPTPSPTPTITVAPLSAPKHIFINTANGVKYNLDGATYGGPNNTYYIKAEDPGMNELHLTNDVNAPYGQVTTTSAQNGTFYVSNTGGRGFDNDIILLVSVKGPIPNDFGIHVTSNGYTWTPAAAGVYNPTAPTDYTYVTGIDQTFSKADFIYGPQTWKPGPGDLVTPSLPLYYGQNISDASTAQYLMFIDLKAGNMKPGTFPGATLNNNGAMKVDYSFTNMSTQAAFNGYAWCSASNQGQGITWTNNPINSGASGYVVTAVPPAPVAGFSASVTNGTAPLAVQFNDQSTGTPASWSWDFGDGTTSTVQNPSHTYTVAGNYTVNLTATNAGGSNTITKTNYITVTGSESPSAPVANFNTNITNGTAPLAVQFTDLSTGAPVTWSWNFGDGNTSTMQNPVHTYAAAGNYTVNLTATNAGGSNTTVRTNYITVHAVVPPTTEPTTTAPTTAPTTTAPTTVPTTIPTTIATTIPTTVPTKIPTTVPTTIPVTPTPTMQPVTANFTANVTTGQTPLAVQFTDLSTGTISQYFWQFGDGGASFDKNPVHTYSAAGTYTVSLVAIGSTGAEVKTIPQYITVTGPGTPTVSPTATTPTPTGTTVTPTVTLTTATTTVTPLPTSSGHDLPIANFVVTYQAGAGSMGIQVTDATTNATTVKYDLGDGTTTAYKNFKYTYWQPGTYTITLIATNDAGSSTKTVTVTVPAGSPTTTTVSPTTMTVTPTQTPVNPNLPVANFTITFQGGSGSMGIQVTNTAVNATSVHYNLGDGTTTAYPNFTYTYWQPGNYTINQTATNAAGSTTRTINVTVPAVATPTTIPTTTVSPTVTGTAPVYNGTHAIPGQLQAEDYDLGGEGVAYHDTTPGNEGGVYRHDDVDIEQIDTDRSPSVGWTRAGEWLAYTVNINTAGTYTAGFRVASAHAGSSVQMYLDDGATPLAVVNVPNTGNDAAFQTLQVLVTLPAGQHRLKLAFPGNYANINWINFA
ncbi:PKD domain-containing protein [Methanosphaerula palustris]|uniref:Carbohydrate binding family 6 n=1 Tax=Methanosphaerula palustris (strain ATCC BAA-1556 / DSM 19958 / E1-9c) TaxID=521011 RepID=B8GK19_METPE|nr:PKD domain-containing protein [Methanosphaerula palustris]ACL17090.1 Carbohydrate binding family 6 [Methanosphaerula palustris E1-9c]